MDRHELLAKLKARELPRAEWTHVGHLRAALGIVLGTGSIYEAISEFRCAAILNSAAVNSDYVCAKRYHETRTWFWISQICEFVAANPGKTGDELDALIQTSPLADKEYILRFYSQEKLDSAEARAVRTSPDLIP